MNEHQENNLRADIDRARENGHLICFKVYESLEHDEDHYYPSFDNDCSYAIFDPVKDKSKSIIDFVDENEGNIVIKQIATINELWDIFEKKVDQYISIKQKLSKIKGE